ncbi:MULTISPECIES: retropepsin-like aspartic protease family protein [Kordiimonas]|jgi:aspartyl protease family protein|uniref:retropepsin-like aspartic protease family protein n=1 Tax=Kordiimonas TaxID=288021 RepID=UPI00257D5EA9|nr:TIGR02281 family clan AA aspartic protease [Kordiimonas sp. UBA4487]
MTQNPWQVPDHDKEQPPGNRRPKGQPSPVLRLLVFLAGMALLLFGLSLAFPTTSMVDPYLIRGLIIILIFGGAAAFWSRSSILRIAKMAGLWALIIAGIAIFYLYRSDLGSRFMSAIDPSGVVSTEEGLMVHRSRDGHFWMKARLNGVEVRFMVDTGASNVVLSPDDAQRVGINTGILDYSGRATTANGVVSYARATISTLGLGEETFYDVPVTINGADMDGSLLGMTVLKEFSSIEFRGDMMILRP